MVVCGSRASLEITKTVYNYLICFFCCYRRDEEIIMPAEHVGVVKENYQWKV